MSTKTTKRRRQSPNATDQQEAPLSIGPRWPRHAACAAFSGVLVWLFWRSRPEWVAEMRLWKAVGDGAYVLLLAALTVGPLAKLVPRFRPALKWRRPLGVWCGLTAGLHAYLTIDGWARWSLRRLLGYEFVPQLGREARLEPGFGLANLVGAAALVALTLLLATSSDRALHLLGRRAWNWLHRLAQTVLILVLLHGAYFFFIHYTPSFHKAAPPDLDWFRVPFLVAGISVLALETAAFVRVAGHRG